MYKVKDIKRILVFVFESQRYIIGYLMEDNKEIDSLSAINLITDLTSKVVKYTYGYFPVGYFNDTVILNTDIPVTYYSSNEYPYEIIASCYSLLDNLLKTFSTMYSTEDMERYCVGSYLSFYGMMVKQDKIKVKPDPEPVKVIPQPQPKVPTREEVLQFGKIQRRTIEELLSVRPVEEMEMDLNNPYNGGDEPRLVIPRNAKPDFDRTLEIIRYFLKEYGVPFSRSEVYSRYNKIIDRLNYIERAELCTRYGVDNIKFSARCKDTTEHIAYILSENMDGLINYDNHCINGMISWKMSHVSTYIDTLGKEIEKSEQKGGNEEVIAVFKDYKYVLELVLEYMELSNVKGAFNQILDGLNSNSTTRDKEDEDIYWFHPDVKLLETYRYQTMNPNLQGKTSYIKECIKAPKRHKMFSFDVTAQDVYSLVWGIMEDIELKRLTVELGSPYYAFLVRTGFEATPENKKIAKVPVLSVMNGKSLRTMLEENEPETHSILKAIYYLINDDPGYKKHAEKAAAQSKSTNPIRWDLFGTVKSIKRQDKYDPDKPKRQALNGPFQITSSAILGFSIGCMCYDIYNGKYDGISFDNIRLVLPIHDELVILSKDTTEEMNKKILKYYMTPQVEGWGRVDGEMTGSQSYIHK